MKKIRIEDGVGLPLAHDLTKVEPGKFKGVGFKRGHIICKEDIDELRKMGKYHVYVGEVAEGDVHEEDCAIRIGEAICIKEDFLFSLIHEGKLNIFAKESGFFNIDIERLFLLIGNTFFCSLTGNLNVTWIHKK